MAMDFAKLLSDPNMLQYMGQAGAKYSSGQSFGEAFNPSDILRQIQTQKATQDLLSGILRGQQRASVTEPAPPKEPTITTDDLVNNGTIGLTPTPIGSPGPNSVVRKTTADKTTTTIDEPSARSLNTSGSNVPPESVTSQKGGVSPFFRALLGQ